MTPAQNPPRRLGASRRLRRLARGISAWILAAIVSVTTLVTSAPSAAADEVFPMPASGSLTIQGKGFGHGHGMSQWGAYGAASQGLDMARILSFYYPGTTLTPVANTVLRVRLSGALPDQLVVDRADAMVLRVPGGAAVTLPAANPSTTRPITAWRLRPDPASSGLLVEFQDSGAWVRWRVWGPIGEFASGTSTQRVLRADGSKQEYRGALRAVRNGGSVTTVNAVLLEDYLRSVVPSEMPASWLPEALKAQTVAARTYAVQQRSVAGSVHDICDTAACQVYTGVATWSAAGVRLQGNEYPASDQAIAASTGLALRYGSAWAFAQFSAANGGWMTNGGLPYLVSKADPYDGVIPNEGNSWTSSLTAASLQATYPSVGRVTGLTVTARDGEGPFGGRITSLQVRGINGSVTVSGESFRAAFGLRSAMWTSKVAVRPFTTDLQGDGRGDIIARDRRTMELKRYDGTAAGTFVSAGTVSAGWGGLTLFVTPGDATLDAVPDLWARGKDGQLWLYVLDRTGRPVDQRAIGTGWGGMTALSAAGDLDRDGTPDLYGRTSSGDLWLYYGDGIGGIRSQLRVGNGWTSMDTILGGADFTGDGVPDIVARQTATGNLYLYAGLAGGGMREGRVLGTGWNGFDLLRLVSGGTPGSTAVVARNPRVDNGRLLRYPLSSTGAWGKATVAGVGWNVLDLQW